MNVLIKNFFYDFIGNPDVKNKQFNKDQIKLIDDFIERLCNPKLEYVEPLNKKETYLLRSKFKIYRLDSFKDLQVNLEDEFKSKYDKEKKFILIRLRLHNMIYGYRKVEHINKMSSYNINRDIYLSMLDLDYEIDRVLTSNGITTLRDLLTYAKRDLLKIRCVGFKSIENLETSVHGLGFKFIDDDNFSDIDTALIVGKSSREKILNSSIYWLKGFSDTELSKLSNLPGIVSIGDFYNYIRSDNEVLNNVKAYSSLVGIDAKVNGDSIVLNDYSGLTRYSLYVLGLDKKLVFILADYNINTLKDLISLSILEINDIFFNNQIIVKKIIDFVHNMGYFFKDELNYAKECSDNIEEILSNFDIVKLNISNYITKNKIDVDNDIDIDELDRICYIICDLNVSSFSPLSEKELYVIRKRMGLLDDGKTIKYDSILPGIDATYVGQIYRWSLCKISKLIVINDKYNSKIKKM